MLRWNIGSPFHLAALRRDRPIFQRFERYRGGVAVNASRQMVTEGVTPS
jgi:hypothetical protein